MAGYTPMIQQYLSIKADYPDAFLFFRLGDFYEMFFEDARKAAEELEITLTSRDGGKERIPMCGVPHHSADMYIGRLIEKGYKVAICEQVEDPASAKGVVKREVVRVVTPGTVMEERMLADKENNFLAALTRRQGRFALAASDLSTGEFYVTEMAGDTETAVDELAAYQPKEVLLTPNLGEDSSFRDELRLRVGALITVPRKEAFPPAEERERDLADHFPGYRETLTTPLLEEVASLLLTYMKQTQKRALSHMNRIERYDSRRFMVLDTSARQTLELTRSLREGKKTGSLLWLLDRTATAMGSRLLKKWLDKPLLDLRKIEQRQEAVQSLVDDLILLEEIRDRLKEVYDLERLSARIAYGSANGRDLLSLRRSLETVPDLKGLLSRSGCGALEAIGEEMDPLDDVVELIKSSIAEDAPVTVREGNLIKAGYDEELDRLLGVQRDGKQWIMNLEQREREETGIKSLKVGFNKVFGYYIEVTKANLRHLPEGRYQRKQTLANAERFVTPELKERERMILEAEEKSVELEYRLFTRVREKIAAEIPRIQLLADQVARLDALHSLATVSGKHRYVRPRVVEHPGIRIEQGRHPVVEAAMKEGEFVANNTDLDGRENRILLITGPNMAGKSTYMRQVALITLMAQIGCFVPALRAEIGIVDRIFTRIGAADDLVGGRSTFMVEMEETRLALSQATSRSLILLDEVGRGTSTYDGMALAQAIVEHIHHHVGAKTLFSTHYHELTRLEDELDGVVNIHARCVERDGEVVFLHRMEPGGADKSYGIHVAQLAGMPRAVIQRARGLLEVLEGRMQTAGSRQLELFALERPSETSSVTAAEEEVLTAIREWDLLNQSPLETVQFLFEQQRKLKEKNRSGGSSNG
ncbi:DNA mismatch repair protein MutS [Melghirimyces profundicolus]|uniref:DNA mismatch repair protein MutS n=1 Tax=Melghirimyces profundicolus TaxID=1242148 RepID=A0A2T6BRL9_9BACL|nr:DNA mismatch repair protein MutS [Melghirimyces profundicolus]PTX58684.1 DNA mismatch repair protein MutS [Melghirimyces profundicolus]